MRAPCPLCESISHRLTDEDILPMWARRSLLDLFNDYGVQAPPRYKIRICRTCNETLGRRYESNAAPIMRPMVGDEPTQLSVSDQQIVAAWIVKTTLLMSFVGSPANHRDHLFAQFLLQRLIAGEDLALSASVRLARYDPRSPDEAQHHDVSHLLPDGRASRVSFFAVSTLGWLAWELAIGVQEELLPITSRVDAAGKFVDIWPSPLSTVTWPPPKPLTRGELIGLRRAWVDASAHDVPPPVQHRWGQNH